MGQELEESERARSHFTGGKTEAPGITQQLACISSHPEHEHLWARVSCTPGNARVLWARGSRAPPLHRAAGGRGTQSSDSPGRWSKRGSCLGLSLPGCPRLALSRPGSCIGVGHTQAEEQLVAGWVLQEGRGLAGRSLCPAPVPTPQPAAWPGVPLWVGGGKSSVLVLSPTLLGVLGRCFLSAAP